MKFKAEVTFKQYLQLLYTLAYEKPIMRLLVFIGIILFLWIVSYNLNIFNFSQPIIYQYITLILIIVVQPIVIYTTIRKNYRSSNHLREVLDIELTETEIKIRGESFYMEFLWCGVFKIVEKPDWFLIYQNNLSAIIIPKKHLQESEVNKLRQILKSHKYVTVDL
jgi:predicted amino acid-binding ACT domain protein